MNLAFYLFVNLGLVVVWGIFTDVLDIRFFWPIVPLLGWGMGGGLGVEHIGPRSFVGRFYGS
jgi:hypothetical protein